MGDPPRAPKGRWARFVPSLAGQTVDKYAVIEEVGHGGMATVYRGLDTHLDREVAIKVLHPHLASDKESRQRFEREAKTTARLRHDNIVAIYEWSGSDSPDGYIVTEFIDGLTLRQWLDERHKPRPAIAAMIVHRLCLALQHAHESGVIHRDLKPENVMVRRDGCLKLMDFGIARILDHQKLTMTGQLMGSPAYMAPELITDKPVDARTDVFSVGIILYQLATGLLPFSGRNPHEVLNKIADASYKRPAAVNAAVDEELEAIIQQALAREPDRRFASAQAMANELEDYLTGLGVAVDSPLLGQYFRDPEACVDELDRTVVAHLCKRAERALAEGAAARALRLIGRALEIDPNDATAKALLDRAKRRSQWLRRLTLVAGILVGGGIVAAAISIGRGAWREADEHAVAKDSTRRTARGRTSPPDPSGRSAKGTGGVDPTATTSAGSDEPPATAGTSTGESGGAEVQDITDPAIVHGAGGKIGLTPARKERLCSVRVEGLPAAMLEGVLHIHAGNQRVRLTDGVATISVPESGVDVQLKPSETSRRYAGHLKVSATTCTDGSVTLQAKPQKARLSLSDLPSRIDAKSVVVSCVQGCSLKNTADRFALEVPEDVGYIDVKLRLQAEGFDESVLDVQLHPGPNAVAAKLDPL